MSGVAVMLPLASLRHLGMNAYQSAFTHDGEIAKPGYHKVKLTDYDITAELTSTMRVAFIVILFRKVMPVIFYLIRERFWHMDLQLIRRFGK